MATGKNVLIMASGTLVSRVLGFVKAIVLAATIGLVGSASADAFANANALPANVYQLISGGLLNAVLLPQIVRAMEDADGGRTYVNRLVTLCMVILGLVTVVLTIGAPVLAWYYGITLNSEQLGLVTAFAYWSIPQIFFYGLYSVVTEVLNAKEMFGPFAWAPVLNNAIAIAVIVAFGVIFGTDAAGLRAISDWDPTMIAFLGGGITLGVAMQALLLFSFMRKAGYRFRPDFHFRGTGLGKAAKLAGWSFGVLVITQTVGWIDTLMANRAFGAAASLAANQNAWMIFMLPHSLITMSIATSLFTGLSKKAAARDTTAVARDFGQGARAIIMFMVFSAVALMVISPAFARIFSATDRGVVALAAILCAALLSLVSFSLLFYTQRIFYAFEDTRAVFFLYLYTAPPHLVAMFVVAYTLPIEWIVVGLALLESTMTIIRMSIQLRAVTRYTGSLAEQKLGPTLWRYLATAVPTAAVGAIIVWLMGGYNTGGFARSGIFAAALTCAIAGIAMVLVYFGITIATRAPEIVPFAGPLLRRLKPQSGRHEHNAVRHAASDEQDQLADEFDSLLTSYAEQTDATGYSAPDTALMQSMSNATAGMLTRRQYREYERRMRREAYDRQVAQDDEPLL